MFETVEHNFSYIVFYFIYIYYIANHSGTHRYKLYEKFILYID